MRNVLILLFLVSSCVAAAQSREVKKMSFEFGGSYSLAANRNGAKQIDGSFGGYFECRYNLDRLPVDLGLHLGVTTFKRDFFFMTPDYRTFSTLAVGDYVFMRGHKISPFVGLGLGVSFSNVATGIFNEGYITSATCMPRIGIRMLNHISLSLDYQVIQTDYSHANLRLGVYF